MQAATAAAYNPAALSAGLSSGQRRALATWLGVCSAAVFGLVVLGGITRLTRSGLSMTDWRFLGERPPFTQDEWEAEFAAYQRSPEYLKVNRSMSLEGFKFIYWMEWAHRMWGRGLGLVFALPAAVFVARGAVTAPLGQRLGLLLVMGGTQGLVGWWMVRSGLKVGPLCVCVVVGGNIQARAEAFLMTGCSIPTHSGMMSCVCCCACGVHVVCMCWGGRRRLEACPSPPSLRACAGARE